MLTSKAITTRLLYISDLILTKLCFLHEDLGEGPADPPYEGCQQHHDEALQVKLGWLKCKHKQTTRDQQDHQDQEWILLGKGQKRQQETAGENNWSCVCKKIEWQSIYYSHHAFLQRYWTSCSFIYMTYNKAKAFVLTWTLNILILQKCQ